MATFRRGHWIKKTSPRTKHLLERLEQEPYQEPSNRELSDYIARDRTIIQLISRDGDKCYLCGRTRNGDYEIEHIIPRSRGGEDHLSNLALACQSCNRHKHASIVSIRIKDRIPCYWIGT